MPCRRPGCRRWGGPNPRPARGEIFLHKEQYSQAEQVLRQALEALPSGGPAARVAHARFARLCLALERLPEAEMHLGMALSVPPAVLLVLTPGDRPADEAA